MVPCTHWQDCDINGGGCCAIDAYERPSFGVCLRVCDQYDGPVRGRGDVIHKLIKSAMLGVVKPCGGCKERRMDWNAKHPSKVLAGVGS